MLPPDFPHQPPEGFSYEIHEHKSNVIGIWIRNHARYSYTDEPIRSIWGFYNTKKQCYIAPINHKRPGKPVDVSNTTAYSAMPLLKSFVSTNQLTNQLTMSISEVMLDRWLLEQIDEADEEWTNCRMYDENPLLVDYVPHEQLSQEVKELLGC